MSLSATFAADDNATLSEVDDEVIIDDNVLSVEEDTDALNIDDQSAVESDGGSEILSTSEKVTNNTFFNYFDETGTLTSDADELIFEGDFTGLNVSSILISRDTPVKFTGNGVTLTNVQFLIMQSNVNVSGFNFVYNDGDGKLINVYGSETLDNITISGNTINFTAVKDYDSYALFAGADNILGSYAVTNLRILNNVFTYVGNTNGTTINNVIRVAGFEGDDDNIPEASSYIQVDGNAFDIQMPSVPRGYVDYSTVLRSAGMTFSFCSDLNITNNRVNLKYTSNKGVYDTIDIIDVRGNPYNFDYIGEIVCEDILVSNNVINALGHNYTYAMSIAAENIEIYENTVNITADGYQASGIYVEAPSESAVVKDNNVTLNAKSAAYGIYAFQSEYSAGPVRDVAIQNNNVYVNAYASCGLELSGSNFTVSDNTINAYGNNTYGVAFDSLNMVSTVENNKINCYGSNVGLKDTGDGFIPANSSKAISVSGNVKVKNNTIFSTDIGIDAINKYEMVFDGNTINVTSNNGKVNNHAIVASDIDNLTIIKNTIFYYGLVDYQFVQNGTDEYDYPIYDTSNNTVAYGVYIKNSNVEITDNKFDISIPTFPVNWGATREAFSEGIVLVGCDDAVFDENNVIINTNGGTSWDTIYGLDILNSANANLADNNITVYGKGYTYGIIINDNFTIENNNISIVSDQYACGIDVEGSENGKILSNCIDVNADNNVYAIYSGMTNDYVKVTYTGNNITGGAYNAFGFSLADAESTLENNSIILEGNYTTGIAVTKGYFIINKNSIVLESSEEGNMSIWESFGVEAVGVKVLNAKASILSNIIATPGIGVKATGNTSAIDVSYNFIVVVGGEDKDAYAVYCSDIAYLNLLNNTIGYEGDTKGTGINNAVYISETDNVNVEKNTFDLDLVSAYVDWVEEPAGSKNYVRHAVSSGIVVVDSENFTFESNNVTVFYADISGFSDTIYILDITDSDDAVVKDNEITGLGNTYIYGIILSGDNFNITENQILLASTYQANGIDIEGPAAGEITNNTVTTKAITNAYPIYSAMSNGNVSVNISDNIIEGEAYYVVGLEIAGKETNIDSNIIDVSGNHTIGIGVKVDNTEVINDNIINSIASNEGDEYVWDSFGTNTTGINVLDGNFSITNNDIETTGDYAAVLGDNSGNVTNNQLLSNAGQGDATVIGGSNVNLSGNPDTSNKYLKVILVAPEFTKVYGSADQFIVTIFDENQKAIGNKTIKLIIDGVTYTNTSDYKGKVTFDINLDAGEYAPTVKFDGDLDYGYKQVLGNITVTKKPTAFTAAGQTVLLTAVKSGSYYNIVLKDNSGNVLASKEVTITFNGKTSKASTDSNGVIKYKLAATKASSYKMTISFAGEDNYAASSATPTIKITKEATKLTAKNKKFKAKKKTKKYSVVLKDSKGKAIKGVKVTIKVGKKTFKAKTNSKGKATFKIKKVTKKGKYNSKVKFAGNNYYNAVTKTVKITLK